MSHNYSSLPTGEYDDKDIHQVVERRLNDQNTNLTMLESSLESLGTLSLSISHEIDLQNKMLTRLDHDTVVAQSKAEILVTKTNELIKRSGGPKSFCLIISLIVILCVLIFLVVYT